MKNFLSILSIPYFFLQKIGRDILDCFQLEEAKFFLAYCLFSIYTFDFRYIFYGLNSSKEIADTVFISAMFPFGIAVFIVLVCAVAFILFAFIMYFCDSLKYSIRQSNQLRKQTKC